MLLAMETGVARKKFLVIPRCIGNARPACETNRKKKKKNYCYRIRILGYCL